MQIAIFTRNPDLVRVTQQISLQQGYSVVQYTDDMQLIRSLRNGALTLIVIDAVMNYGRHNVLCQWRRSNTCTIPLLVAGTFTNIHAMRAALESDAADIVVGPINADEFGVRMLRVLHRPLEGKSSSTVRIGRYLIDQVTCRITLDDKSVTLTAREYQLAAVLLTNPGVHFSRDQLSRVIWSSTQEVAERSLEQYIYRLRKKLQFSPQTGAILRTLYAQGYRLEIVPLGFGAAQAREIGTQTDYPTTTVNNLTPASLVRG
jgi:DNA-binding response OmpR family regulator